MTMAAPDTERDDEGIVPGYRNYLVYSDESGIHGATYYGFGTLWMPHERRGDFAGLVADLRAQHRYDYEIKWNKVKRDRSRSIAASWRSSSRGTGSCSTAWSCARATST
jgi:hypothetical protein